MANQPRKRKNTNTVHVNTTGGTVRITQPSSSRAAHNVNLKEKAAVVVDVVTPKPVEGFFGFLREHAVVGVGIGLVIGSQLKVIVDTLNTSFINPLFGLLFNGGTLQSQTSMLHWHGREATLAWGQVAFQVINFIFVMAVIYALIKLLKLDKLDKKPEDK